MDPFSIIPHIENTVLAYTPAQSISIPYTFQAYDFSGSTAPQLDISLMDVGFINQIGSIALTLYGILNEYRIISIVIVILLALAVVALIYRFVTETPTVTGIRTSEALGAVGTIHNTPLEMEAAQYESWADDPYEPNAALYRQFASSRRSQISGFNRKRGAVARGIRLFK